MVGWIFATLQDLRTYDSDVQGGFNIRGNKKFNVVRWERPAFPGPCRRMKAGSGRNSQGPGRKQRASRCRCRRSPVILTSLPITMGTHKAGTQKHLQSARKKFHTLGNAQRLIYHFKTALVLTQPGSSAPAMIVDGCSYSVF